LIYTIHLNIFCDMLQHIIQAQIFINILLNYEIMVVYTLVHLKRIPARNLSLYPQHIAYTIRGVPLISIPILSGLQYNILALSIYV
jgi:hypothetical protein